ncbi:ABC transporter permease [Bifidobacterium imperatoris]
MLGVVFDVGDKLNAELSTYGSNITVQPKSDAVVSDLYNTEGSDAGTSGGSASASDPTSFLKESDAAKIKTIFWAFNITNFAPELNQHVTAINTKPVTEGNGWAVSLADYPTQKNVPVVGTWFNKKLKLASGETTVVGVEGMRSWWSLQGRWPKDGTKEAVIGKDLAKSLGVKVDGHEDEAAVQVGGTVSLMRGDKSIDFKIVGVYDSGDDDNSAMYVSSNQLQDLTDLPDSVNKIEVKALTTPENDLARKAAKNPAALSQDEWETWYCTAYPSSIAYQIEEVIPGAVAKQVRQVAALQGNVLQKTQAVMILMTVLSLIAAAVAVANLMVASIGERSSELALLKAIGATDGAVSRLMMAETAAISLLGAIVGAGLGSGVAQLIGHVVFGSGITMRPMVFVLVFVLLAVTVLLASASSIRSILSLKPAEVLHGR